MKNKIIDKETFRSLLKDDMTIMFGGFMTVGTSDVLIEEILKSGIKGITAICNDAGFEDRGLGKLVKNGQVKKLYASHIGLNPLVGKMMSDGTLEVELSPQGTLVERIRSGGAGLGGVLTPTGIGTDVEKGKQIIEVQGKKYILEEPLRADMAIIRGRAVDRLGNVVYARTARNFNPVMATAADIVVVGADQIVEVGSLDPEEIITPHIFVDYIVKEDI
ncbi:3-oxoacid CoA-transferase subunit A [Biomaibacter acetigenes]|uniref:3-oxoacid CoA-transferase subunit A n=1 Tax=Biomaibacter acetigenes TaxID=2316383 RepID=A0A3G2R268_9FIRM|nr:3-oxoacid CoA-transferase subunit A [Biomaibacter acetigenes]AYO29401.1 3-oxoacid CoA-transferase subunit A [Biomaibacter acetigenes]